MPKSITGWLPIAATIILFISFCFAFSIGFSNHVASGYRQPTIRQVTDGHLQGEVILGFSTAGHTQRHIVGWISQSELKAVTAQNRDWMTAVTFEETTM